MSARPLDTGAARDVSGVLRVTCGGDVREGEEQVEDKEVLYHLGTDGSVKVFEIGGGPGAEA